MTIKFKRYSQTRIILTPDLRLFVLYLPMLVTAFTRSSVTGNHKNNELGKFLKKEVMALFEI